MCVCMTVWVCLPETSCTLLNLQSTTTQQLRAASQAKNLNHAEPHCTQETHKHTHSAYTELVELHSLWSSIYMSGVARVLLGQQIAGCPTGESAFPRRNITPASQREQSHYPSAYVCDGERNCGLILYMWSLWGLFIYLFCIFTTCCAFLFLIFCSKSVLSIFSISVPTLVYFLHQWTDQISAAWKLHIHLVIWSPTASSESTFCCKKEHLSFGYIYK